MNLSITKFCRSIAADFAISLFICLISPVVAPNLFFVSAINFVPCVSGQIFFLSL